MRKICLAGIVLILIARGGAVCETVLLYVGNGPQTEKEFEISRPVSSALEDGVMNEFFDRGHIIFNAGIKMEDEFPEPPYQADRLPMRVAKAGGASYLLEVVIYYSFAEGEDKEIDLSPAFSAEYTFSQVSSSRIIYSGGMSTDAVDITEELDPEMYSYVLGQMIAREALSLW